MKTHLLIAICGAVFASSGFWAFLTVLYHHKKSKVSNEGLVLRGIAHDRICFLGEKYLRQGYISKEEYESLYDYLYVPYLKIGGNGTAQRIMEEVEKLPHFPPKE